MAFVLGNLPIQNGQPVHKKWFLMDADWTLVRPTTTMNRCTLAGGPFCVHTDDWTVIPGRIERMNDFVREGYSLAIVSNQMSKGKRLDTTKQRMQNIYNYFVKYFPDIVLLYATDETTLANKDDHNSLFRKPGIGWAYYLRFLPGSLFVGDACQDTDNPQLSWGYSDSDRQFAINMGLPFYSPEQVFPQLLLPAELFEIPKIVLILVGPPGSGKSSFSQAVIQKYPDFIHIESDKYGSNWQRVEKAFRQTLSQGKKIIIDATNPSRERRLQIIRISREYNAPSAIILFLNSGKWNTRVPTECQPCRNPVSKMGFNMFWSRFEEPTPTLEDNTPVFYQT